MDKFDKRAVAKYLFFKEMSGYEIHDDMFATLGNNVPSCRAVKNWVPEFRRGRNSVENEHHSGRPKNATCINDIRIVNDVLKDDRHLIVRHSAEATGENSC